MSPAQHAALTALAGRALTAGEVEQIDALLPGRRDDLIAAILSSGRVRAKHAEVGKGAVIEVLGLAAGNAFLDIIDSDAQFRHVKHLLTDGRLRIDSALVAALLAGFVQAGALSQAQADSLLALGREPDPIAPLTVSQTLNKAGD